MANDLERMSKAELIGLLRQQQQRELRAERDRLRRAREELGTYQDLTHAQSQQLRETQEALGEAHDRFMSMYHTAPVAFATLDRNGVIEDMNDTGLALLRLDREHVLKRPLLVFVTRDDRQFFLNHMARCRKADRPCNVELRLSVRGGDPVLVQLTTRPATRAKLGGICYLTAIADLTELRAAEAERQRLAIKEQAARAASQAKDHFLAVLSHELRTPLTPVVATLEMLNENPRLDPETREHLEMIRRNIQLEARLIDDLLDVTRIAKGKIELEKRRTDLHTIIQRAIEVCTPDIQARRLQFSFQTCDSPYMLNADPVRLQQVVWNLLKNAVKFTPQGGQICVRCRNEGDQAIVEVRDTGHGIDAEVLPRLFSAFEQGGRATTRQFGGLGLGLAISKAITEMHGGTLTASSEGLGHGATFTLRLPILPPQATTIQPAPHPAPAAQPLPPARPLHILLVEDHPDTARIMRKLLSAGGHQVEIATDVATALDLAREHHFDLMLSDLGLPDGSGLDLIRALHARGQRFPSIALSGYGQEKDMQQSREAGFLAHLTKPVNLPKLEAAIASAINGQARQWA